MRKIAAITVLLATAGSACAGEVVMDDPLDGTAGIGWEVLLGEWAVRDGAYHISGSGQTFAGGATFADFDASVECRITDCGESPINWVGMLLGARAQAGGNPGYLVYIRYSGAVEVFASGTILAAKQTDARARFGRGEYVRLEVAVRTSHLTVRVDGEVAIEAEIPEYQRGSVGLASYGVQGDFRHFRLRGEATGNTITGQVLALPGYEPTAGVRVETYNSMDGYDSLKTAATTTDQDGHFVLGDLPAGERAYWLRAGREGHGGTTGWFVSVTDRAPTVEDLYLVPPPRHDIWIDSSQAKPGSGFREVADMQCFGGSRLEVKETRPASQRPEWWAELEFDVGRDGDYVPYLAAGLYPTPHYWSDYWWCVDDGRPVRASETLTITGSRYGDRSTLVWASGRPIHLRTGKHVFRVGLRDPAPHGPAAAALPYWWSFDAVCLAALPTPRSPVRGSLVRDPRPELRWRAPRSCGRFAVQYSQEPDFSNATATVGGVGADHLRPERPLADGTYYWRVKAVPDGDSAFVEEFTPGQSFTVETAGPAIRNVRIARRRATEAVIEWETDEWCTAEVAYGLSAAGQTRTAPPSSPRGLRHRARLVGLEPMAYYYYTVQATDRDGNRASSLRRGLCTTRGAISDRNSPFGIFGQGLTYSRELGRAGARWYSDYWDWGTLNPGPGQFHWEQADQRMARAEDSGVNLLVTFWGTPAWTRPSHPTSFTYGPEDLADARDLFRQVAAHCAGRADWWLPWIEPNVARDPVFGFPLGYWSGRPHAQSYAAYQRAAYEGAKEGNPDCRVVGMNTAGIDLDFIRKCYDEGAADTFDVMNVHYYAINAPFEQQQPERLFAQLRAVMSEYGDSQKPILCSEGGGASSGVEGTTEATQADNLIRIFVLSIANGIDKLCWTFELDEKPYGSKRVDMIMWMGLFRFDPRTTPGNPVGEPKPSFYALRTMTEFLRGTEYRGKLDLGEGVRAYRFTGPGRRVVVAWAEKGETDVELPVRPGRATIVDRAGAARSATAEAGKLRLRLTGSPVFVREERH